MIPLKLSFAYDMKQESRFLLFPSFFQLLHHHEECLFVSTELYSQSDQKSIFRYICLLDLIFCSTDLSFCP